MKIRLFAKKTVMSLLVPQIPPKFLIPNVIAILTISNVPNLNGVKKTDTILPLVPSHNISPNSAQTAKLFINPAKPIMPEPVKNSVIQTLVPQIRNSKRTPVAALMILLTELAVRRPVAHLIPLRPLRHMVPMVRTDVNIPVTIPVTRTARPEHQLPTPAVAVAQQKTDAGIKLAITLIKPVVLTQPQKLLVLLSVKMSVLLPASKTAQLIIPVAEVLSAQTIRHATMENALLLLMKREDAATEILITALKYHQYSMTTVKII